MKKSLVVLAFGTLGLGIAEFGMMSILSAAAEGLGISIAKAGHLISAYALGVCFGAVALVFLSRGKPLKTLLIALMAVMCAGNLLAVFAPNYELMMMARFISGLPHGGYFGVAGIAAKKLAARGKEVEAVSVMISGMTVANLLGIPMASYLTHIMSWHMLFAVVAAWGLFTIYAIRGMGTRYCTAAGDELSGAVCVSAKAAAVASAGDDYARQRRAVLLVQLY